MTHQHQKYAISYDTEEQLQTILDIILKHNSAPFFNEFVCLQDGRRHYDCRFNEVVCVDNVVYLHLRSGEILYNVMTATLSEPYPLNKGPTLSKVVYCCNDGGYSETNAFLVCELRRQLHSPLINVYEVKKRSIEKRMTNKQKISQDRVGGSKIPRSADLYNVKSAVFITEETSYTFSSKTNGYVVGCTLFDDFAAAEEDAVNKKRWYVNKLADEAFYMEKYKQFRAAGKKPYFVTMENNTMYIMWLTDIEAFVKIGMPDVKDVKKYGYIMTARYGPLNIAEVDAALANGEDIRISAIPWDGSQVCRD